eukprot:TRINITY_DN5750_c0_g1_i1.p1 TRINITY_DN5750_c0_g1~~TRINITY_DN5750_c0_g1_i1.p1  ORF type:complete len:119 (+),score=17.70 TRINITY_DN5750_c0_g1_i1:42-398(+)
MGKKNRVPIVSFTSKEVIENGTVQVMEVQIKIKQSRVLTGKLWNNPNKQLPLEPIIAVHGWLDNCGSFDPMCKILAQRGHLVFAMDFAGHGLSSHMPGVRRVRVVGRITSNFSSWGED